MGTPPSDDDITIDLSTLVAIMGSSELPPPPPPQPSSLQPSQTQRQRAKSDLMPTIEARTMHSLVDSFVRRQRFKISDSVEVAAESKKVLIGTASPNMAIISPYGTSYHYLIHSQFLIQELSIKFIELLSSLTN